MCMSLCCLHAARLIGVFSLLCQKWKQTFFIYFYIHFNFMQKTVFVRCRPTACVYRAWPTCFVLISQKLAVAHHGASHMQTGSVLLCTARCSVCFGLTMVLIDLFLIRIKQQTNCFLLQTCFQASEWNGNTKIGDMLEPSFEGINLSWLTLCDQCDLHLSEDEKEHEPCVTDMIILVSLWV